MKGRLFFLVREGGLARRARRRVAALERPRRSIHSRSRSSPPDSKKQPPQKDDCFLLVREGGLEPPRPEWTLEPESPKTVFVSIPQYK